MSSRAVGEVPPSEPSIYEKPAFCKNLVDCDLSDETASLWRLRTNIATEILFHVQEHCVPLVALQLDGNHLDISHVQVTCWANLRCQCKVKTAGIMKACDKAL